MKIHLPTTEHPFALVRGDSYELLEALPDGAVDHVLTDPPYAEKTHAGARTNTGGKAKKTSGEKLVEFDSITAERFVWLSRQFVRVAKRWVVMTCDWRHAALLEDAIPESFVRLGVWCLSSGTQVYVKTPTGPKSMNIKDMVRLDYRKLKLWNGQKWTAITGWAKSSEKESRELTLVSGERINCTASHVWPTRRGNVKAADLVIGDVIQTCRLPEPEQPMMSAWLPDDDIGWFVGTYLADGSRGEEAIQIASHTKEVERLERLKRISNQFHGTFRTHQESENSISLIMNCPVLNAVVGMYVGGRIASSKYLSSKCWERSNRFLAAVCDGYLQGDAHYDAENDRWRLGFTENRALESSLRTLASRLGYSLTIRPFWAKGFGKQYPSFRGQLRKTVSDHHSTKPESQIVSIGAGKGKNYWDIGVADEPHLFALASGVLTHNCKPNGMPQLTGDRPSTGWEAVAILHRKGRKRWNSGGHHAVWTYNKPNNTVHPTQKPVALVREWLRDFTDPGELVLDPFAGSGTTAMACLYEGRRTLNCEHNETYCAAIKARTAKLLTEDCLFRFTPAAKTKEPDLLDQLSGD